MNDFTKASLRATLNLIPAHTWYADPSGALTFVNERCADYLGLPQDHPLRTGAEIGGAWDSHIALLHPDDRDESRRIWSQCLKSRVAGEATQRVRNSEGLYRWFLSRTEPRWVENGTLLGWIGINLDIDTQKRSEFYLAEAQRVTHAGSWAFSGERFEYWSSGLLQIHGLAPGANAPSISEYLALVHANDRDSVLHEIQKMLSNNSGFDFTKRIVRPDGEIRHIRCVGMPASECKVFSGIFSGFIGIGMDVTEQVQLTNALRKSEKEFRQILDLSPQLIAVVDSSGERIYANAMALEYLGMSLDEWRQGIRGTDIHPDDRERHLAFVSTLSGGPTKEIEVRVLKKDGSSHWLLARYNSVCDDQGQPVRWFIACTDIEERKRAEEKLQQENVALREEIDKTSMFEEIIGRSAPLLAVLSRVTKVASSDSTVLITGETGTGKELVARAIHRRSRRAGRAFVAVNCAAIPRDLINSELFGHEKGAFTGATQRRLGRFELADGGTIFLDEVGELLPDTQVALLRVLQEQEVERLGGTEPIQVDVRVVAATNRDLDKAVADGSFRQDLFYRLNVFPVEMPALRERTEDIPLLVAYFIDRLARNAGKTFQRIDKGTLERLQSYPWPGNVRELQNVIERSVIVCDSKEFTIDESWLPTAPSVDGRLALSSTLANSEKTMIEEALRACNGRVYGPSGAASRLGLPRSTLESKIRSLKVDKSRFR